MNLLKRAVTKIFLNWEHPVYSKSLFKFSAKYVDFCYGDNNFDRETNGEYWFLRQIIPPTRVVFDVGANVGDYARKILEISKSVAVHSFEPDPRAFEKLQQNSSVTANNCALGEKAGEVTLYRNKKTVLNSLFDLQAGSEAESPVRVKMQTLDSYCSSLGVSQIDFLKIDVEGYEYFVLKGAEQMLKKGAINIVQFEFSGATLESRTFLKDFLDFFAKFDYTLYRLKPQALEKIEYYPDQERFTLTNYVAVRNDFSISQISQTKAFYH